MARRGRKLKGAAKAAFLRRMARGRRRAGLRVNPGRKRRSRRRAPARSTATRRRSAGGITGRMLALLPFGLGGRPMARRKRRKSTSRRRRRRNPGALLVNPRRKRRRSRRRARRRNALVVNPRRRRRRSRRRNPGYRRRRRNPGGIMGFARQGMKDIMMTAIPATIGGVVIGVIDSKLLGPMGTVGRTVGKLVTAVLVAAVGRRWLGPMGTGVAMGAILGTIGHEVGIRIGGGFVATSKKEGVQELVEMAATDAEVQQELGALIEGGIGDESTATAVSAYEMAINGQSPMPKEYDGAFDDEDD